MLMLMKYRIETTMTEDFQDFFANKLVFKRLGGHKYLVAYNGETARKVFINCQTIEFIEDMTKIFPAKFMEQEEVQND